MRVTRGRGESGSWQRRLTVLAAIALVCAGLATATVAVSDTHPPEPSPALCAPGDPNPEPGIQGDVPDGSDPAWDCGVRPVGFLEGANGAMAVASHCAYTGGDALGMKPGVRVIDVSDPTRPRVVTTLKTSSRELLAAQVAGDRALLATRHRDSEAQEGQVIGRDMLVDIWDIRTCTDPKRLGTVRLPTQSDIFGDPPGETGGPAHNLKFNPSATKLYGSLPLHEIDLTDLTDPDSWTVRNLHCSITDQHHLPHKTVPGLCEALGEVDHPFGAASNMPATDHEPTFSPFGTRLYIGAQLPGYDSNAMWILDMTTGEPVVRSVTQETPGHSIDFMTIAGRQYLLHSNEIGGASCIPEAVRPRYVGMGDRAWVLDITDETKPEQASEIILEDSRFTNCLEGDFGGPSTAYHDVDDPLDTTYAVINFGSAGFRFFDMRDPRAPVEVAYFNHGASEHTKSYIIPETGQIWAADANGFWVLELEPHVRRHLGLDDAPAPPVCGRPGQPPAGGQQGCTPPRSTTGG